MYQVQLLVLLKAMFFKNRPWFYFFYVNWSFYSAYEGFSTELENEYQATLRQRRQRWESLKKDLTTKLQLLQSTLEQDTKQPVLWSYYFHDHKCISILTLVHFQSLQYSTTKQLVVIVVLFQFYSRTARVSTSPPFYKREAPVKDKSTLKSLYSDFYQAVANTQVISLP